MSNSAMRTPEQIADHLDDMFETASKTEPSIHADDHATLREAAENLRTIAAKLKAARAVANEVIDAIDNDGGDFEGLSKRTYASLDALRAFAQEASDLREKDALLARAIGEHSDIKALCESVGVERWIGRPVVDMVRDLVAKIKETP